MTPNRVFRRLVETLGSDDPVTEMKAIVRASEKKPYYDDLLGKAQVLLLARRIFNERTKEKIGGV
ncbi:MAG: hypothetical protein HYT46_03185 [Candidatus Vogelbacteria bacterium]|nr:hypothetical protein [Candidatus Vogelbacteria bacterium]